MVEYCDSRNTTIRKGRKKYEFRKEFINTMA